jgi:hypothetical protein
MLHLLSSLDFGTESEIIPRFIYDLPSRQKNIPIIEINVILRQPVPYQ